jgi:hypothetical protein
MEEGKVWDTDCDLFVHDYELLLSWGQLCQSLKMCTLPTRELSSLLQGQGQFVDILSLQKILRGTA